MGFYLCLLAFALCYLAGRQSLVTGLAAVLGVGYLYGVTRANVPDTYSHFIFDAGVAGLYAAQLFRRLTSFQQFKINPLKPWIELLIIWPLLLFLIPIQDILIQLVGLRGNIFLLPFLLLGARLDSAERYQLALCVVLLNLIALGFATAEFFGGIEKFFPHNEVTKLIYMSNDVGKNAFRIPASFANAHSYGGTMATTMPLLLGALIQKRKQIWHKYAFTLGSIASLLGILMCAARTPFILVAILIIVATFSIRAKYGYALGWIVVLLGIGWMVSGEERLQRFMQLNDTSMIAERVSWSVNMGFFEAAAKYPFGNGLGGGGTSIPYFLQDRIIEPAVMENEYGRIMLEQGLIGLVIWIAFIVWLLTRPNENRLDPWHLGRRLAWVTCAVSFAYALTGTGLFTSVPQTCLLFLTAGWVASHQSVDKFSSDTSFPPGLKSKTPLRERQYG
jgi:hypothetical protein